MKKENVLFRKSLYHFANSLLALSCKSISLSERASSNSLLTGTVFLNVSCDFKRNSLFSYGLFNKKMNSGFIVNPESDKSCSNCSLSFLSILIVTFTLGIRFTSKRLYRIGNICAKNVQKKENTHKSYYRFSSF